MEFSCLSAEKTSRLFFLWLLVNFYLVYIFFATCAEYFKPLAHFQQLPATPPKMAGMQLGAKNHFTPMHKYKSYIISRLFIKNLQRLKNVTQILCGFYF